MPARTYIAIDLKSFYASVECVDRKLDPLTSNLVVADLSRTEKTICLAVSPALKGFGVPGRPRLFEVVEKVRGINAERLQKIPSHKFTRKSSNATELNSDRRLELDYIVAVPRMGRYMQVSSQIYSIYLTVTGDLRFSAARIPASGHALPGWCVIGLRNPDPGGKIQRRKNGAGHGHRFHVLRRLDNTVLSTVFSSTKMSWKAAVNELFIIFLYNNGFCLTNRNEYDIVKVFTLTNNERRIRCHESAIHRFFTACLHREDRCRTSAIFPVRQKRTETLLPEPMK